MLLESFIDVQSFPHFVNIIMSKAQSSGSFTGKEELEISLQKFEKDLKEACQERDKALQELKRLKQHLLEKVLYPSNSILFCRIRHHFFFFQIWHVC